MKKIMFLFASFLLVGCSAEYTITINNNQFNENIKIDFSGDETVNVDNSSWNFNVFYDSDIDYDGTNEVCSSDCYNYEKNGNIVNFSYDFNLNNISKSSAIHYCFNSFRIMNHNEETIISTEKGLKCFDDLDSLKINVIFSDNREVLYNNADKVINNKYIWEINRNNYKDKSISMTIKNSYNNSLQRSSSSSNSQLQSRNNNFLNNTYFDSNLLIFSIIFLIVGGIGLFIFKKINKDNE